MAHVADILFVERMEVATLYPALADPGSHKAIPDSFIRIYCQALRIWYAATGQDTRQAFSHTIFYTLAGVYHQTAHILHLLQQLYRSLLATHIDYDLLFYLPGYELLLAVSHYGASTFAQLFCHEIKDCGVVAYMVWRKSPGSHYAGYIYIRHN